MTDVSWNNRKANLDDLKNVREYIRDRSLAWNLDASAIYDLMMAATEAMTNIILYGYHGQAGLVKVTIQKNGDEVAIIMEDEAAPFDPNSAPHPNITLPLEKRPPGGFGIFLMQDWMDQINHEVRPQGGNKLTLIKRNVNQTSSKEV